MSPGLDRYEEGCDALWEGGPRYRAIPGVFPLSSDSAWLGAFVRLGRVKSVCDLGCGGGVLLLQLLGRKSTLTAAGVDILPQAVEAAQENLARNGWSGDIRLGDLRDAAQWFPLYRFDLVISNPPYYPASGGRAAGARGMARTECCTPAELSRAAAELLREGGRFCLCYPPQRLSELFCALTQQGLEPKRLRLVMKTISSAPCTALVEAIRGGGRELTIEPPLLTEPGEEE